MPKRRRTRTSPEENFVTSGQSSSSRYSSQPSSSATRSSATRSSATRSTNTPATSAASSRWESGEKRRKANESPDFISKSKFPAEGSPWDTTERYPINVEELDLDVSYAEYYSDEIESGSQPNPVLLPRQERWQHHGPEPLNDVDRLPSDWNTLEPDLDDHDIEGQIVRCKERIEDNIMPSFFQMRLKKFQEKKNALVLRDKDEPRGLDDNVYRRIETLKVMRAHLREQGDRNKQIQNIDKILAAYRSKRLTWTSLVTYWSKGNQLSQPRPFSWDEFEAINAAHSGHNAFWVEGLLGPGKQSSYSTMILTINPRVEFTYTYDLAIRAPGVPWWISQQFIYDTGASLMTMDTETVDMMLGPYHPGGAGTDVAALPCVGNALLGTAAGQVTRPVIEIEVAVLNRAGKRLSKWIRVPVCIAGIGTDPACDVALDGPLLGYLLFVGTVPDNTGDIIVSSSKTRFNMANTKPEHKREIPVAAMAAQSFKKVPAGTMYKTAKGIGQLSNHALLPMLPKQMPDKA